MKKRFLALFMASLLAFSFTACGSSSPKEENSKTEKENKDSKNTPEETEEDSLLGGYQIADSPVITDEIREICTKAFANTSGVGHSPVALVATQVVSGTNYCILFRSEPVIPDPVESYVLGYLYQDLDGNVEVLKFADSSINTDLSDSGSVGGWTQPDSPEVTDEVKDVLAKACEGMTGTSYTPIALVSTQIVAGTNYRILCEKTLTTPGTEKDCCIVTVYQDLDGNAEISDIADFTDLSNIESEN